MGHHRHHLWLLSAALALQSFSSFATTVATTRDSSANAVNATLVGAPAIVASPLGSAFGNAISFSGVDNLRQTDALFMGPGNIWSFASAGSVELTVKRARTGQEKVFGQWPNPIAAGYLMYFSSANKLAYAWYDNSKTFHQLTSPSAIADTNPHQIEVSWDGTTARMFIDGAYVTNGAAGSFTNYASVSLCFGRGDTTSDAFQGIIDEVRFSSVARHSISYTPATLPFTNDAYTTLLLHLDSTNLPAAVCTRISASPVLAKGGVYNGWTADALAAPSVSSNGVTWAMTVSLWSVANSKWASAFFTGPDLKTWTYVNNSLLTPGGTDYIIGNGGFAWFSNAWYFSFNNYASAGSPNGISVQHSTDLLTWTTNVTKGIDPYGADPSLVVNPNTGKLESWYLNVGRCVCYSDSTDGTTWTSHGVQMTNAGFGSYGGYVNIYGFGEPQVFYYNGFRYLIVDGSSVAGARRSQLMRGVPAQGTYYMLGEDLFPISSNPWENTQVFDATTAGIVNFGDGRAGLLWLLYAGSDNGSMTDNTDSSIGLVYLNLYPGTGLGMINR